MFSVYANARYTTVQLYFAYFPEDKRLEMKNRFEQIPGIRIPAERLAKYPGIDLLQLKEPQSFDLFVSIFKDYIADIMK